MKRRRFIKQSAAFAAGFGLTPMLSGISSVKTVNNYVNSYESMRPVRSDRSFESSAVEDFIKTVQAKIDDPELAWLFGNCFPNTLDTTVEYAEVNGKPDTFVITGDIHAMWLRDSAAQVWPYLPLMKNDESLRKLIAGVVNRQTACIMIDPYANAFNKDNEPAHQPWASDLTDMKTDLHERKWEIDSLCYAIRLAHGYWKESGDDSVFDASWQQAADLIVQTFIEQQRLEDEGPYRFMRETARASDTQWMAGYGLPTKKVGLIHSMFRPSDDATVYPFLIPSNLFASHSLKQLAEIHTHLGFADKAEKAMNLSNQVHQAVMEYAVKDHLDFGEILAFEVDGFGNALFMDDSNVPSLLSLAYLGVMDVNDPLYQRTRNFVLSDNNPFFHRGKIAEGVGGPHVGLDMLWPMSIIMRAFTSTDDAEKAQCIQWLKDSHAGTGFMHEAFHKDDASNFTRSWFAWANTLFGELIASVYNA